MQEFLGSCKVPVSMRLLIAINSLRRPLFAARGVSEQEARWKVTPDSDEAMRQWLWR